MGYCADCGHELGAGRFCTGCGRPVDAQASGDPEPVVLALDPTRRPSRDDPAISELSLVRGR